jgi:NAD(P)-dependent dehydrogenase (short-subunit alcohol dehydrogenase family)
MIEMKDIFQDTSSVTIVAFLTLLCAGSAWSWTLGGKLGLDPSKHAICITGCDSGFGEASAVQLALEGFHIIATVQQSASIESLQKRGVKTAVVCDVTKPADLTSLESTIERYLSENGENKGKNKDSLRLWAVVNNAGIAPMGYTDWMPNDVFRHCMAVNFFGVVAVTKICLPHLKRTRGARVINVSSLAGHLAGGGFGAYAASKHALEVNTLT